MSSPASVPRALGQPADVLRHGAFDVDGPAARAPDTTIFCMYISGTAMMLPGSAGASMAMAPSRPARQGLGALQRIDGQVPTAPHVPSHGVGREPATSASLPASGRPLA